MLTALALPGGRFVVPGNRWDLVPPAERRPTVSVVVPYYDGQRQLDRLLAALAVQTYPADLVDVVVADDGSPEAPSVPARLGDRGPRVRLVRQEDRGFRAAAARNLGVAASWGEVLCFLDQDLVPEPEYLARLVALPALLPDALVVGHRRHADLTGWDDAAVHAWLTGAGPAPHEYPEPAWLAEAYARTRDLLDADDSSFRYLISAVMCCSRELFDDIGGFDESFVEYGGEDWEFAYRAALAGAVPAHRPGAVAWHDGPDWAVRGTPGERAGQKQVEDRMLARLVPHPVARRSPSADDDFVDVCVCLAEPDAEAVEAALGSGLDLAVYLSPAAYERLGPGHPRVRRGPPPPDVLARARFRVDVEDAAGLTAELLVEAVGRAGELGRVSAPRGITVTRTAATRRARRWQADLPGVDLVDVLFGSSTLTAAASGPM